MSMFHSAVTAAPTVAAKVKEDSILLQETRKAKKTAKAKSAMEQQSAQAAE